MYWSQLTNVKKINLIPLNTVRTSVRISKSIFREMEKVLGGCVCVCDGRSQIQRVTRHLGQIAHVIYLIKLSEPSTFFNPCTQICKVCLSGLILSIFCVRNGKVTRCFSSYGSIISGGKSHSSWKSRWIRSVGICSSQTKYVSDVLNAN